MGYLRLQYHAPHICACRSHAHAEKYNDTYAVPERLSHKPCAYPRAARPISGPHRMALRAARMQSLGLRQAPHAEKARLAATSQRAAAIAAAGRRRPRPAAYAPPVSKGRARSAYTPAATTTTRIVHLSWQSCASRCILTNKFSFFQRARQAGRTGGKRAYQCVYRSRLAQKCRARGRS